MLALMLRPVPSRPPGPVDRAEALRHVAARLPELDEPAAAAIAAVALAGQSRAETASQAGISEEELGERLARARKALRRALHPLPGSGWCERAERMISDRIDDALRDPGPARLEAHLANCQRCVDHERRLTQAQDTLMVGLFEAQALPPEQLRPAAPWLAQAEAAEEEDASVEEERPWVEPEVLVVEPPPRPWVPPEIVVVEPPPRPWMPPEIVVVEPPPPPWVPPEVDVVEPPEPQPPRPEAVAPIVPAPATELPPPRTALALVQGGLWSLAAVFAVLLMLASVALAVAGVLGAEL
jgi:hypothetical protein